MATINSRILWTLALFIVYHVVIPAGSSVLPTSQTGVETKNVTANYCPQSCTIGNQTLCYMVPCPVPPCQDPAKHKVTDCCFYCPNGPNCKAPDGSLVKVNHWKIIDGKNCTCEMYNVETYALELKHPSII